MATGDSADMRQRLVAVLPPWFSDDNPVLNALLAGAAAALAFIYALYAYARDQVRITTATGIWLDLIALDFFGATVLRGVNESDDAFRARIMASLFRPTATRAAISAGVKSLVGEAPKIIEPFSPADCGAYDVAYAGYDLGGAWGATDEPAQAFLVTELATIPGVGNAGGYNNGFGGYDGGYLSYTEPGYSAEFASICALIAALKAEGVVIWVALSNQLSPYLLSTEAISILTTEGGEFLSIE